jgi:hypothetical protein
MRQQAIRRIANFLMEAKVDGTLQAFINSRSSSAWRSFVAPRNIEVSQALASASLTVRDGVIYYED